MIIPDQSNNGRVFHKSRKALEVLILSLGLASSLAMVVKTALSPHSCELVFSSLIMASWNSVKCLLSSHICICIIINFMVLLIAASSHRPEKIEAQEHDDRATSDTNEGFLTPEEPPIEQEPVKERPVEAKLEEEVDTMEAAWRSINGDGKQETKRKNLVKCETWDMAPENNATPKWKELRKSETFNDSVSMRCRGGLIRRDPSSSLEEFNKQVEAFIKRFNDDMKLQRQESDQRFLDMVKRGL